MTQDQNNLYAYDAEGRACASSVTGGGGAYQYAYDAEGARYAVGTLTNAPATYTPSGPTYKSPTCAVPSGTNFSLSNQYLVDLGGNQVTEIGWGNWTHSNVWIGGKLVATYDSAGPSLHFNLEDPLGTKRVQADILGQWEENCSSLPFGNDLSNPWTVNCSYNPNTTYNTISDATEHHFTGKERDAESGNDYFGARYYASSMGRFMSPDWSAKVEPVPYSKLEFPQTLNLYAYVLNNPLIHTDPDGHACGGAGQPPCGGNQPGEQLQAVKDLHAAISPPPEDFSRGDMAVEPSHASYSITTGQISLVDTDAGKSTVIGTGYSGKGDGLNNPSMENVPGSKASPVAGPLPEGKYTIGKQQDNVTGSGTKLAGSERLTPQGGSDMHGRGGFLIHGDNARQNNSASEGCIVTSRATRDAIGASGDRTLDVDR